MSEGWDCHVHVLDASASSRSGHYEPVDRPLKEIEAVSRAHGVGHLVLVQPSVYGTDNSVMLGALSVTPGRHRGVAVVADDVVDADLEAMHALGVRGVRFNLVSPVGETGQPSHRFAALSPRLLRLGWHVQWYARAHELPKIEELHRHSGLTCVLDHLAGFEAGVARDGAAWDAVKALAGQGAWLKLSGWYRLGAQEPYTALIPHIQRLAGLFGKHLLWGSDWPHTLFASGELPSYAGTWQPVVDALGPVAARALRLNRPAIYR